MAHGAELRRAALSVDSFPSLNTFKYDVGTGIDLHYVGFYVAKSLTDWSNSAKFIVRLRHRF